MTTWSGMGGRDPPNGSGLGLSIPRLLSYLAIAVAGLILIYRAWRYCSYAVQAIRYPFGLDYGEGIVWQQAVLIPGPEMYGDITRYPFIVFHYPPLYHLVTRMVVASGADWLTAGRAISVVSTLSIVVMCAVLIYRVGRPSFGPLPSLIGAAFGGLTTLTHPEIIVWSPLMRVDMLAVALSFAGLLLCERSFDRPRFLYGAVIAFIAAVYTKQTAMAAALAGLGPFLILQLRRAFLPVLLGFAVAVAILIWLSWYTEGRFLQHIITYNINRFDIPASLSWVLAVMWTNQLYLLVVCIGIAAVISLAWSELNSGKPGGMMSRLRHSRLTLFALILLSYLAFSSMTLIAGGKSGAGPNYDIEWLCVLSLFIGVAVSFALHSAAQSQAPLIGLLAPLVIAVPLVLQWRSVPLPDPSRLHDTAGQHERQQLVRWVHQASKPVLSDDMVLLMSAGKEVPLEPAIFAELSATGQWDERHEIDLLTSGFFQFVVTLGDRGDDIFDSRYNPGVADAIESAYPRVVEFAGYKVRLPNDSSCDAGPPLRCPPDMMAR
jgi:hypothetical protein